MDSTLSFLLQKNSCHKILLAGTVAQESVFFVCCFLRRMTNGCDLTQ